MMTKKCTKCNKEYPGTKEYFYSNKKCKDSFNSWCRSCYYKYRQENKEKHREYMRGYCKTFRGYVVKLINAVRRRCNDKKFPGYANWGGRGIKCYFSFTELYNWLIKNNINPRGLDIHRIDNNENYTLDNIEFLDKSFHRKLHHPKGIKIGS